MYTRSSKTLLVRCLLLAAIVSLLVTALPARAQAPCDGCIVDDTQFNTYDLNGWQLTPDTAQILVGWLEYKNFDFLFFFNSYADGVLDIKQNNEKIILSKSIYLQPGVYRVTARMASEVDRDVEFQASGGTTLSETYFWSLSRNWSTYYSGSRSINVLQPMMVTFKFVSLGPNTYRQDGEFYIDYITIDRLEDSTPQPPTVMPGQSTYTPTSTNTTPTPIPPTASPMPTGTAYCNAATATPTPQYGPATTPTPDDPTDWGFVEHFSAIGDNHFWTSNGTGTNISSAHNHTTNSSSSGSEQIPASNEPEAWDGVAIDPRPGLTWTPSTSPTIGFEIYVDGYAIADFVPQGVTVTLEIYMHDSFASTWSLADSVAISHMSWYPFHLSISQSSPLATTDRLAFVAHRSDGGSANVFMDDIYIYGNLAMAPFCGGTYPDGTVDVTSPTGIDDYYPEYIYVPENKPCPGTIDRPNNFWGHLLAQITLFTDQQFAKSPYHMPGQSEGLVQSIVLSPVLSFFTFLSILFDWTIPIWALEIMLVIFWVSLPIMAWKFFRRATVQ